jgi:hypothetical protein
MPTLQDTVSTTVLTLRHSITDEITQRPAHRMISPEESRELRYAYRDGTHARNSAAIGKKDSTSVWLSKETLIQMLEACEGRRTELGNEGVQVHWATYPEDHPDAILAGHQTIIIEAKENVWFGEFFPCPPFCPSSWCPKPPLKG